jgi:hypothetical protein
MLIQGWRDDLLDRGTAAARSAWRRADAAVGRRVPADVQAALAPGVLGAALLLTVAGLLAALLGGPGGPTLLVDRMANGQPARDEALLSVPQGKVDGTGAVAVERAGNGGAPPAEPTGPAIPAARGALPVGKGKWLYVPEKIENGDVNALVARAKAVGLTHVYVRTGSSRMGFYAQDYLNRLLPVAHAHQIRVYGWDFPYLDNWQDDVNRAMAAITWTTPDGHRIDGFSADIETRAQGVNVAPDTARAYGAGLRRAVGPNYPLIATVPRPSPQLITYPFAEVVESFDAIAPMVYWLNREPGGDAAVAMSILGRFGKPLFPIGQAYDGAPEGGRPGVPPPHELFRFMHISEDWGAAGTSFWSWQHASPEAWNAIRDAAPFQLPVAPAPLSPPQVRAYQVLLTSLGFPVAADGVWGPATVEAVSNYQRAARLPVTGVIDAATFGVLFTPFAPPIQPQP